VPVHNVRVTDRVNPLASPRLLGLSAALVIGLSSLTACSGGDDTSSSSGSSGGDSSSASPYLPVPDGVTLTEPGTQLSVGDHAVVAYHPRQNQVGALDIDVTKLEKSTMKDFSAWQLTSEQRKSTPYYVHAKVKNVGSTDLGGRPVPLYVVNDKNVLLESTPFASSFDPCPSTPFPHKFKPGATANVCLVYLAPKHGKLEAVSFRPDESFNPITWSGKVEKYQPPAKKKHDKNKHDKSKQQGGKKKDSKKKSNGG
jgi:hypothetical protein